MKASDAMTDAGSTTNHRNIQKRLMRAVIVLALCIPAFAFASAAHASLVTTLGLPENIEISSEGDTEIVKVGYYDGDPRMLDGFADDERKSGYGYDYLQQIAPLAAWNYEYVYCDREQAIKDVEDGVVDVVVGVSKSEFPEGAVLFSDTNMGLISMGYEGSESFFAVTKDRPELVEQLNSAIATIKEESPEFLVGLWQEYYANVEQHLTLTPEESAWLEKKGAINVGVIDSNLPISNVSDDGTVEGVSAVVVDQLRETTGVEVNVFPYSTIKELIRDLYTETLDCAFPLYADPWINEARQLFQTQPILSERAMVVFRGEYSPDLMDKVAISATGLGQRYFVLENYPDSDVFEFPNRAACLEAVDKGEANCIIGASAILQRMMQEHPEYKNYSIAYLEGNEEFAICSARNNAMLADILNKAALQISQSEVTNAMVKYSTVELPYTLMNVITDYAIWFVLFWVTLFAILACVYISYRRKVKLFNAEQAKSRAALEDALVAASNASEAKTKFLSSMSHDIRTPMNGIIGMTAIATANIKDTSRVKECLAKITSSSKHLLSLINEILDVSKIESGKLDLAEEPFSFPEMMEDLIVMNDPLANAKKQHFDVEVVDLQHEVVEGDRVRLQQIYTNLVSNAIKYTPEGGNVKVTLIEKSSGSPTIGRFDFIVEDNGIGMSEDYLPHVFEAFTRDSGKTVTNTQGTGLGMPIALSLARMMNGDITVKSKLGEGSTFTCSVFLKLSNADTNAYQHLEGLNVLVVDDDVDACTTTSLLLEGLGMSPEWTTSGREAVEMISARERGVHLATGEPADGQYFAVLLDWVMPEMDGIETIKAIRERVEEKVPIVVISAHDWTDIELEARQAGAEAFVNKPLFKSNIAVIFDRILGKEEKNVVSDLNKITEDVSFEGKHALLAEDNELNAEIAVEFLGMTGLEIDHAVNGQIALDMVEESDEGFYDCIFMDIQMPVMNGLDSAVAIRKLDREDVKSMPIFAMTADAFVDDIKASREAGMDEHFAKPLDFDYVIVTLKRYL